MDVVIAADRIERQDGRPIDRHSPDDPTFNPDQRGGRRSIVNGIDEQAQEKGNKDPVPWKLRPSDALCSFLRQLGGVTLRVAEAETALETKAIDLVGQSLSALTLEWSLLKADLIILRRVQPKGAHSEVVTLPAMQMARDAIRKVFLEAMAYMAENHARDLTLLGALYRLAELLAPHEAEESSLDETSAMALRFLEPHARRCSRSVLRRRRFRLQGPAVARC